MILVKGREDVFRKRPILGQTESMQNQKSFDDEVNMNTMPKTVSNTVSKTRKNVLRYGFLLYVNVDQNTANTNTCAQRFRRSRGCQEDARKRAHAQGGQHGR